MVPIGVKWFLTRTGPCATAHLEAGGFIRSREGIPHPNVQYHFLPSAFKDHGRVTVDKEAFQVSSHCGISNSFLSGHCPFKKSFLFCLSSETYK